MVSSVENTGGNLKGVRLPKNGKTRTEPPAVKGPLKAKELLKLPPGAHRDRTNLFFVVRQFGDKTRRNWIFRYYTGGQEKQLGLGSFTKGVSLDKAREKALRLRAQIIDGKDPATIRREEKAAKRVARKSPKPPKLSNTFEEVARAYFADQKSQSDTWLNPIIIYAFPILGELPVHTITTEHLIEVLEQPATSGSGENTLHGKFWALKWETANKKVRARIKEILDWATVRKMRSGPNPAEWKGNLSFVFPSAGEEGKKNLASLPFEQLHDFLLDLRKREGTSAKAMEFAILTAMRTGTAYGATWDEIDETTWTWTIPKSRMKTRKSMKYDHRVPLSAQAIALLKELPREEGNPFVFIGPTKDRLSSNAMLNLLGRMGWKKTITIHGFRSTFKNWAMERTKYEDKLSELALAHVIGDEVYRAYMRSDLFEKRREMMQDWADFGDRPFDARNVVNLHSVAAE